MTTQLTSREEMERVFSTVGIDLRVLDVEDVNDQDSLIDEIVDWASETLESYTLKHYDTVELVNSKWARRRATILACYYLSQRKGNAPQFVAEAKRVMEDLTAVNENKIMIPDAIVAVADVPAISSFRVDDRYVINKQRTVRSQSTQPYVGQQAYEHPFLNGGDAI